MQSGFANKKLEDGLAGLEEPLTLKEACSLAYKVLARVGAEPSLRNLELATLSMSKEKSLEMKFLKGLDVKPLLDDVST